MMGPASFEREGVHNMLQTTIKTALYGEVEGYTLDNLYALYIVRDDSVVLYVGHSVDPLTRLERHIGVDFIGELIRAYAPTSLGWQFEMLTFADCAQFLDITDLRYTNGAHREQVERSLIAHYRPCCNKANNPHP